MWSVCDEGRAVAGEVCGWGDVHSDPKSQIPGAGSKTEATTPTVPWWAENQSYPQDLEGCQRGKLA